MRVVCVAGARPNFMKIKPVVDALESRGASVLVVHTEQHYDDAMSEVFLNELGLRSPDIRLGAGSGTHSRDRSMPEEINRIVTDAISDVLFAPSRDAVEDLMSEGLTEDRIFLVGNVMIDTLMANLDRAKARPILTTLGVSAGEYGLVTLHRPTNVDDRDQLSRILGALEKISVHLPLIFPVHPRTKAQLNSGNVPDHIRVVDPLGYLDFVALESQARLVFTDSGGVQEETTVLGVPCLTLRDTTERPITVLEGTNMVVGQRPDVIARAASLVLENPPSPRRPELWDGRASERSAYALLQAVPQ